VLASVMMSSMGTWGNGALDNDAALGFVLELEVGPASSRPQMIYERLRRVADQADYMEGPDADEALAAAVLVLVAGGGAVPEAPALRPPQRLSRRVSLHRMRG
jgi:hypothetical protein